MYVKEDGKTFYEWTSGELVRAHDENYFGMRFRHRRCPFCNRITSIHTLHWLNHIEICAPIEWDVSELLEMRYKPLKDLIRYSKKGGIGINRKPTTIAT